MHGMEKKKQGIDVINELLEECILAYPVSSFVISLYKQYNERGSLSKKQLQGLHSKATKITTIAPGKLATVEAIINKMPTRDKTPLPQPKPVAEKDTSANDMIEAVLAKYPAHKRVLYLKVKYDNNEPFSHDELNDLKRFSDFVK